MPHTLTADDTRQMLQSAVAAAVGGNNMDVWVRDFDNTHVFYESSGQTFQAKYTFNEDETAVELGEPEKVAARTVYTPIESLQQAYGELIHETGGRLVAMDAPELKTVLAECQAALGGTPDEETVKLLVTGTGLAMTWLESQPHARIEGDVKLPRAAFLFTPNDTPDTWRLPIWETATGPATKKALAQVAAALSPGGLRGVKADVPAAALPGIKRAAREACRDLGLEPPRWIAEPVVRARITQVTDLKEAKLDAGIATIVIIAPGFNVSKEKFYPQEMLARDFEIFEGAKMFADHPTEAEDDARPERSVRDWVATITEVSIDDQGRIIGKAKIIETWMQEKLANMREQDLLGEMGVSINAIGMGEQGEIDGTQTVIMDSITAVRSVDFVTEPGAGGEVTMFESGAEFDIDLVSLEQLREHRPDLVTEIEEQGKAERLQEARAMADETTKVEELTVQVGSLTEELATTKTALEEAEMVSKRADAKVIIDKAISEAELPQASKDRLTERFAEATDAEAIEEAVKAEVTYIAALTESGTVINMGEAADGDPEKTAADLKESFRKAYPDASDKEIETMATGR